MKEKIIIIDGNSLVNRAFFAMPPLTSSDGTNTNAIYGFLKMLNRVIVDFKPTYLSVAFDLKGPTFRHLQYPDYKGTRKGMADELREQIPVLKEFLDMLKIHRMELQGFEADDLIGTVATKCSKDGIEVIIITGDKDALQLIDSNIRVYITKKGISQIIPYDENLVYEEFGINPNQIIDFKGLSGDNSDNIPGIPGVGPKTASKLLAEFNTVEELIERSDDISNKRIRNLVEEHRETAVLSKQLARIVVDVPIEINMEEMLIGIPDREKMVDMFLKYGFKSIISDFYEYSEEDLKESKEENEEYDVKNISIKDLKDVKNFIEKSKKHGEISYKIFHEKGDIFNKSINSIFFALKDGENFSFINDEEKETELKELLSVFSDPEIKKIGYETKMDYILLRNYDVELSSLHFDGYIASYLIHPEWKKYEESDGVLEYFGTKINTIEDLIGKGAKEKKFSDIEESDLIDFGYKTVFYVSKLYPELIKDLEKNNLGKLYFDIELPLVKVLADVEYYGFNIDKGILKELDEEISEKIGGITEEIYRFSEEEFNINSPKQLGDILFNKLGLPPIKKTKTGFSTGHDVLEKLMKKHPIIPLIIEYRAYTKLKSTYIDGLYGVINEKTNRIHTSLNQTVAVTGRLSSTEPNLQNIPIRLPLGRKVRKIFIPSDGNVLIDADYSQIELRILAHMSNDENLKKAFIENIDVHSLTASQVFDIPLEEVTSLYRSRAKEVNFGIVYGMSDYGLSENLNITRKEAKEYIDNYFKKYEGVKKFMDKAIEKCKEDGFVTTLFDRKRFIPEINHKNFNLRSFAERTAMNTPIQGTAADIIKIAMVRVNEELEDRKLKSKLILQVHDELIVDASQDEIDIVNELIVRNMENAAKLSVPLKVDINVGSSWYETK